MSASDNYLRQRSYGVGQGDAATNAVIEDLLDKLATLRAQFGWRPIESAPKDVVLLYFPAIKNDSRGHGGHAAMYRIDYASAYPFRTPSHWMPVPAPPTE